MANLIRYARDHSRANGIKTSRLLPGFRRLRPAEPIATVILRR
ncbi:hypothetical protein [Sphingomonas sp. PR090111-T3T-6A]|jgi:hypothetical protein|nr:hypothetical protein [Sphingomonas sp. PR090111-T3T-6A]